jgi:hypothetical protein
LLKVIKKFASSNRKEKVAEETPFTMNLAAEKTHWGYIRAQDVKLEYYGCLFCGTPNRP